MGNKAQWDDLRYQQGRLARTLTDPAFHSVQPQLTALLSDSRRFRDSPVDLMALQAVLGRELRGLQDAVRHLQSKRDPGEGSLQGARRAAYVLKQIGDGIAWRTLGYNRPAIQVLSMNPRGGRMDLQSTPPELRAAATHMVNTGRPVILNDLTNVLTYGDWTGFGPDGHLAIGEEKAGKGSRKSGRAATQSKNRRQVLQFLRDGIGVTKNGPSVIFPLQTKLRTHLKAAEQVLSEARRHGAAHARVSEYVAVEAWHLERIFDDGMRFQLHNPFVEDPDEITMNSLAYFDRMSAGPVPYSIFPFSDQDCTDLMTGAMCLIGHFHLGGIFELFSRQRLRVTRPPEDEIGRYVALHVGERRRRKDELSARICRSGTPGTLLLGGGAMSRLIFEFLHEESLAEMEGEIFDRGVPPFQVAVYSFSPHERLIWN